MSSQQNMKVNSVLIVTEERKRRAGRGGSGTEGNRGGSSVPFVDTWPCYFNSNLIAKPRWIRSWQLNLLSGFENCYGEDAHSHTRFWLSFRVFLLILLILSTAAGWVSCHTSQLVPDSEKHWIWFGYRDLTMFGLYYRDLIYSKKKL